MKMTEHTIAELKRTMRKSERDRKAAKTRNNCGGMMCFDYVLRIIAFYERKNNQSKVGQLGVQSSEYSETVSTPDNAK